MGYKQMDRNMTFAEVDLMTSMEHNRSLKMMQKINQIIDWSKVETALLKHYTVGTTIDVIESLPSAEVDPDPFQSGAGKSDQRPDFFQKLPWSFF